MAQRRQKASPKLRSRRPPSADVGELLKREREEHQQTLQRERATSEILRVIAESQADLQPVFDTIVRNAVRLCGGTYASAFRYDGEQLHRVATTHKRVELEKILADVFPTRPDKRQAAGRAILAKGTIKIEDVLADPAYGHRHAIGRRMLAVPMLRSGEPIGAIAVTWAKPGPISERQEELLKTFADQAVIAIENVRLFNELQASNANLRESLEQQTATVDILSVISGAQTDTQPVFAAIVKSALRIFGGMDVSVGLVDGNEVEIRASTFAYNDPSLPRRLPLNRDTYAGRAILDGLAFNIADIESPETPPITRARGRTTGWRAIAEVPMVRDGVAIGFIAVHRAYPVALTDRQFALLKTFAAQAVIAIENVRLFNETKEALERQTGTADILKVISGSPSDVRPVFQAVAKRAAQLCEADASVWLADGDVLRTVARVGPDMPVGEIPIRRTLIHGRAFLEQRTLHLEDAVPLLDSEYPDARANQLKLGFRTFLSVPMAREGRAIGTIGVWRDEVKPFSPAQIELLETFAAQAVIAIENVRLFNETKEGLEQQTAISEILRVISSSPADVQPVLQAVAERAMRICEASNARIFLCEQAGLQCAVELGGLEGVNAGEIMPLDRGWITGRAVIDRAVAHIVDVTALPSDEYPVSRDLQERFGHRTVLVVPLLREQRALGAILLRRKEVRPFTDKQIALLKTFADQAAIAIENVRLFNETKEALEQQTATAEILKVISSSPTATQPVFEAIVQSAARLFAPCNAVLVMREGDVLQRKARAGPARSMDQAALASIWPLPFDPERSMAARCIIERRIIEILDTEAPGLPAIVKPLSKAAGYRSITNVPLLREGEGIGLIALSRPEPGFKLTEKQLSLVRTFADQAVIAIENARLFNETKEALERQTASADVLRVIGSSPSNLQPVFDSILENAMRLCDANLATVGLYDGKQYRHVAQRGGSAEYIKFLFGGPFEPNPQYTLGRMIAEGKPFHAPDYRELPDYKEGNPRSVATVEIGGTRTYLAVPMLKDGRVIGGITVRRTEVRPFTQKQIDLVKTFADQAVIAIENARLFNETKEALEQQTATAEILKVIAGSPSDAQPVFDAIARSSVGLCGGMFGAVFRYDGEKAHFVAHHGFSAEALELMQNRFPRIPQGFVAQSLLDGAVSHSPDVFGGTRSANPELHRALGTRAYLGVPMLLDGRPIGAISVFRREPGPFADSQIAVLQTFAAQAVIAIENVRLFKELQERTRALTKSVGQLTALGEVGQAISSTLDLETVLKTIVSRAVQLANLDGGWIYEYDHRDEGFYLRAAARVEEEILEVSRKSPVRLGEGAVGRAGATREPVVVEDLLDPSYQSRVRELLIKSGSRALLVVPLLREDLLLGALAVSRKSPGPFAPDVIDLLKTFATQSAVAIQNARLFAEIAEKGKQLEVASQHKSQFLASMSHELRTPLNAILGFNEMMLDGLCGEVPAGFKDPLDETQKSGKHLLRLINNVLDLAKIEAGRMELAPADYSVHDTVESVRSTLRPLAAEKGLEFLANVPGDIPLAYGDAGRITQCLMNLAGNSLKFTKEGRVEISVQQQNGQLRYRVTDTGIGIPLEKISSLFTEFKQTDAAIASEYGGTGLGLSITKKFIEMHGGRIWVESEVGKGSAFIFEIPLKLGQ